MCGIAGIIDWTNQSNGQAIAGMNARAHHRGPDGAGEYHQGNVHLGHTRLSIIDLSDGGHQPMVRDHLAITFNGEIYNYLEIKAELQKKGHSFTSSSDTEVILRAYQEWGQDCVKRFNGMWAFAIHDQRNQIVFCSRDRFGIKPFHYYQNPDHFIFASEIGQLTPLMTSVKANTQVLSEYLIFGLEDHSDHTFFKDIQRLPAAHNLMVDLKSESWQIKRYYTLECRPEFEDLPEKELLENLDYLLEDAVRLRLRSDVKVGSCLSGGIDSSLLTAVAAQQYTQSAGSAFFSFTAQSTDPGNDESSWAKMVADHCGLDWHLTAPATGDFQAMIPRIIALQQEPFGSPGIVMQYYVMKQAREQGCIVLLDGQGGDETWLGYPRYLANVFSHTPVLKKPAMFRAMKQNSALSAKTLAGYILYFSHPAIPLKRNRKRWHFLSKHVLESAGDSMVRARYSRKAVADHQILELSRTQLPHLLRYEDRNSMAHAVETRLPYLDYRLVELAVSSSPFLKVKHGWTKYPLRKEIEKRLPREVAWRRKKIGFEAPVNQWFSNRDFFDNAIRSSDMMREFAPAIPFDKLDHTMRWRLYNIAVWQQTMQVSL
jgi:asparagine synthase (glutamine-hydrolysing)